MSTPKITYFDISVVPLKTSNSLICYNMSKEKTAAVRYGLNFEIVGGDNKDFTAGKELSHSFDKDLFSVRI